LASAAEPEEPVASTCCGLHDRVALPHGDELDEHSAEPVLQRVHLDEHRLYAFVYLGDTHNECSFSLRPHYMEVMEIHTPI
jgi:hypothetical protein